MDVSQVLAFGAHANLVSAPPISGEIAQRRQRHSVGTLLALPQGFLSA